MNNPGSSNSQGFHQKYTRRYLNSFRNLARNPGYTLMRVAARFSSVRSVVANSHSFFQKRHLKNYRKKSEIGNSLFSEINPSDFVSSLREDGAAFGLKLPSEVVDSILEYSKNTTCYADRDPTLGFELAQRQESEKQLEKPILVAQYFNTEKSCAAINKLSKDPFFQLIASEFLGSIPQFVGVNLWWTFPVLASEEDRDKHAHFFHRDLDDFRFIKFFFYLTDVVDNDGAHVCVLRSQDFPPRDKPWKVRRYSDIEINEQYSKDSIREISGRAGDGFAENTLCVHKGMTPTKAPRLLLQFQFAMFDYGVMNDHQSASKLKSIL